MNTGNNNKLSKQNREPVFTAVSRKDPDLQAAYRKAGDSIDVFIEHLQSNIYNYYSAKLRFRDPDESERLGEDRFLFIWLSNVHYHAKENVLSGEFVEVPPDLSKWHHTGQKLTFDKKDIFDWMVLSHDGKLKGGYTLRVTRNKLPEDQRQDYDRYIGVSLYE